MKSLIQETRNDVLARSLAPTVSFAILASIVFFSGLSDANFLSYIRLACALILAANIWRGSLYAKWKRAQNVSDALWTQFKLANFFNSLSWGVALAFVIQQNEAAPLNITLVIVIAVGITNASILTLGNDVRLHTTFVLLSSCPLTAIFFQRYCKTLEPVDLSIAFMLLLSMGYVLSQARTHRRRFAEKLAADNALIASQKELLEQTAMTEHANRLASLGEMAAGFAHEINNPLAVITGNVELLHSYVEKNNLDPGLYKYTSRAIAASQRITRIVKSLRTLSHRSVEEVRTQHDITTIINDTLEFYSERLSTLEVELRTDLLEQKIFCDPIQVEQVLINLMNNARDAVMALPKEQRWIQLQVTRQNDMLVISVTNGGPAIDLALANRIFTPFFTTKPVGQGMGLGLAISRTISLKHKGDLQMQISNGHTCFRLLLPIEV